MVNPEAVTYPDFSWKMEDCSVGTSQKAYEIEISSSLEKLKRGEPDVWNSGELASSEQIHVTPPNLNLADGKKYWWRVRLKNSKKEWTPWSQLASFGMGLTKNSWKADWITVDWDKCKTLPYLRKEFKISKKPQRAVVYMCALGCGDLFVNGLRADETRILDPAQTNYEQYAFYNSNDITSLLKKGYNRIGVMLGDGWYHQDRVWGKEMIYGRPKLILQMEIIYEDGHRERIVSDESWQWQEGPVINSNIYAGETYDANKEITNWCHPEYMGDDWNRAVKTSEAIPDSLAPQMIEPIRLKEEVPVKKAWKDKNGNWIIDFGINMAAVPVLNFSLSKGTRLKLRMGECLNADSTVNFATTGVPATGVFQTDEYICDGNRKVWIPRFTYHGYRYIELSGLPGEFENDMLKSRLVYTDVSQIGEFKCGNEIINRLHELAVRTFLSNIHGIPTDCPQRERCGWLGDAHTVAPFEMLNRDMENFFIKYFEDIKSSGNTVRENVVFQKLHNTEFYTGTKPVGIPFMIAPGRRDCGVASPDWGTAQVQIPWDVYWFYGNKKILEDSYQKMKIWTDYITGLSKNYIVPYGLGDWCPPGGNAKINCPVPLSSTAFHYYEASIMEKTAKLLGKLEESRYYSNLKTKIAKALVDSFYIPEKKTFGNETADAMALDFGFVPKGDEKDVAFSILKDAAEKHKGFISTGIFGTSRIGQALARNGCGEEAFKLFTKKGENSFQWMWTNADATTLWEVLPVSEESKKVAMDGVSLNHPMQGAYDTWFYEDIAGLRPAEAGYKKIHFERIENIDMNWASGIINTPYGKAESSWKKGEGGTVIWNIIIPANASGEVVIPVNRSIEVNGRRLEKCHFIKRGKDTNNKDVSLYEFPSGTFEIGIK